MVDQDYLNQYFSSIWHRRNSGIEHFEYSGLRLIDQVKAGESIIDVGCGNNPFKGKIPNLIGIDPAFDQADVKCGIDEYNPELKFDVAFCLGSINFGTRADIERQTAKVVSLLKPSARIYWRCNPGRKDHGNAECEQIPFYNWSFAEHIRLAEKFSFKLVEIRWENNKRIYAEWSRTA
jgi:hypothetical protein